MSKPLAAAQLAVIFKTAENPNERNMMIKQTMKASELKSFVSIPVMRAQAWLAGILILLSFPNAFAESDFSTFWKEFKSAVVAGDKAKVAAMTKFPLSMPYEVKAVKNKESLLRRYDEVFKGEANAT